MPDHIYTPDEMDAAAEDLDSFMCDEPDVAAMLRSAAKQIRDLTPQPVQSCGLVHMMKPGTKTCWCGRINIDEWRPGV